MNIKVLQIYTRTESAPIAEVEFIDTGKDSIVEAAKSTDVDFNDGKKYFLLIYTK